MIKIYTVNLILIWAYADVYAQAPEVVKQGVVLKQGTPSRVGGARIVNLKSGQQVYSNGLGNFAILAMVGDTLEISKIGFTSLKLGVLNHDALIIYLLPNNIINEVVVQGSSLRKDLEDGQRNFRKNGVFYKGKPRLYLLFLKPFTFIYENFGKNPVQARRFNRFASRELEYHEISVHFNNTVIKQTTDIDDKDIEEFKTRYWPLLEQVRTWSNYDIILYIKKSYQDFLAKETPPKF